MAEPRKNRPYWHVDAKWICSAIALVVVCVTLLGIGAWRLTNQSAAPTFVRALAENLFNNPNTDSKLDGGLTDQQLRVLYDKGPRAFADTEVADPVQSEKIAKQLKFLSLFTAKTHTQLGMVLMVLGGIGILVLGLTIFFSHRIGKIVTPAVVLLASSIPGTIIFLTLQSGKGDDGVHVGSIGPAVTSLIGSSFLPAYLAALATSITLLVIALFLTIIRKARSKNY